MRSLGRRAVRGVPLAKLLYDAEVESAPREELERLQLGRLRETIDRACRDSRFYHNLYEEGGVGSADLSTLEDAQNLPFLDGPALKEAGPHGLALGQRRSLVSVCSSPPGRQRTPVLFFSRKDHRALAALAARGLWMAGVREGDLLLNLHPYHYQGAAWGYHLGAQAIGACVLAAQLCDGMDGLRGALDLGPTALCCTAAAAGELGRFLKDRRARRKTSRIGVLVLKQEVEGGEGGEEIERLYGVEPSWCYSPLPAYAGIFAYQCAQRQGWHVPADGFFVECIDPVSGDWVPEGSPGEMVVTWLGSDGSALIRHRTGLLVTLDWTPCDCGRTQPRLTALLGRASEALRVGKRLVFPRQVERALQDIPELGRMAMRVERPRSLVRFHLRVELKEAGMTCNHDLYQRLVTTITERLTPLLGLSPILELLEPGALPG